MTAPFVATRILSDPGLDKAHKPPNFIAMKIQQKATAPRPGSPTKTNDQGSGQTAGGTGGAKNLPTTAGYHKRRRIFSNRPRTTLITEKRDPNTTSKTGNQSLNILQFNISGLNKKKTELAKILCDLHIHVAMLQESLHQTTDPYIGGYTSYRCKCQNCRGILTYLRNDITGEAKHHSSGTTDIQEVTVWWQGKKHTVLNVYSPPEDTCSIPLLQETCYTRTIICGDFNGHSPRWGYANLNSTGKFIEQLADTTNLSLMQNKNSPPTLFHRVHKTWHRPDLTLISADLVDATTISVADDDMGSDHRPIITQIHTTAPIQQKPKTRWNFKKADWGKFKEMTDSLLNTENMPRNINKASAIFVEALEAGAKNAIPRGSRKLYKPFWSQDIEKTVNNRKKAKRQLDRTRDKVDRTSYNKACALVKQTVSKGKRERWRKTCSNLDLRRQGSKAWSLLNNLSGKRRKTNPQPVKYGDEIAVTDQQRAETINRFFTKINKAHTLTKLDHGLLKNLKRMERNGKNQVSAFDSPFTKQELEDVLRQLPVRKSPGPDSIHNEMLQRIGNKGKAYLLRLINLTWEDGQLPTSWKTATVIPILKAGKETKDPNSYRPISLTSCIGKVAERMVNKRLYWWLETHNKLAQEQAGFRKNSRTEDCIFQLTQAVHNGFQENKHTAAIFIDLQKAYDKVWRKGLLYKMQKQGIQGKMYNWVKNFLTDRTMATKINNAISKKTCIEDGLPQGSALSCTLFLIYINDVTDILQTKKALFADDIVLWHTSRYPIQCRRRLNEDLKRLWIYCQMWKIQVSVSKTKYCIFTMSPKTSKTNINLCYGEDTIEKENNPTYLGMVFDQRLTFGEHVEQAVEKATKRLNLLKRLGSTNWGSDKNTLRTLYLGYVRSILEYNSAILSTCSKTTREKLDKVQNKALRFVCGGMKTTPTAVCEIDSNVIPLEKRREQAVLEAVERYHRMPENHPNQRATKNWEQYTRIKQRSLLDRYTDLQESHRLPQEREIMSRTTDPPHAVYSHPKIQTTLIDPTISKDSNPIILKTTTLETIDSYPQKAIKVYTDGSAFKATVNAGYGAWIIYPDGKEVEIAEACGAACSNYEAELTAMVASLENIHQTFTSDASRVGDIVIFTDSLSALQALENRNIDVKEVRQLREKSHSLIATYAIHITMQWVPGHAGINGNEKADKLAKAGAQKPQPPRATTFRTAKQIISANVKMEWMNDWAIGHTGRQFFQFRPTPKSKDSVQFLSRKEQTTIFRLRTGHVALNYHLNRINPERPPNCDLCNHPYETVDHHLYRCPALKDLRDSLLPPLPETENCLFSNTEQLKKTCKFHHMAMGLRAKAQ